MCFVRGIIFLLLFTVKLKARISTFSYDNLLFLDDVIGSVSNLVTFFENHSKTANLDGIFIIHSSQEQLTALLEKVSQKCLPEELLHLKEKIDKLSHLQDRLKHISDTAIPRLRNQYTSYFKKVSFVFGKDVWKFLYPFQYTNKSLLFPTEKLNLKLAIETFTDDCINEWDKGKCNVSASCMKFAIELYHQKYYLTHQYLILLIGKLHGCEEQIDKITKKYGENVSTAHLLVTFCSNILTEVEQLAQNNFPEQEKDLFMEQVGLCGLIGFHEFFHPKWIKEIISWQHSSGCFKSTDPPTRVKRDEVLMTGGCYSHMTGVALLALQQAVRYLLEPHLQSDCKKWDAK